MRCFENIEHSFPLQWFGSSIGHVVCSRHWNHICCSSRQLLCLSVDVYVSFCLRSSQVPGTIKSYTQYNFTTLIGSHVLCRERTNGSESFERTSPAILWRNQIVWARLLFLPANYACIEQILNAVLNGAFMTFVWTYFHKSQPAKCAGCATTNIYSNSCKERWFTIPLTFVST